MKMAVLTAEARTTATAAMALVMIARVTLTIAHFVTRHVIANAIAHVVAIPLHLSACNEEGDGKGGKINDNGDKEGNGNGGKSNGNGDKEGKGEGGKRDGDGIKTMKNKVRCAPQQQYVTSSPSCE